MELLIVPLLGSTILIKGFGRRKLYYLGSTEFDEAGQVHLQIKDAATGGTLVDQDVP